MIPSVAKAKSVVGVVSRTKGSTFEDIRLAHADLNAAVILKLIKERPGITPEHAEELKAALDEATFGDLI